MVDQKLFSKHRIYILAHLRDEGKSRFNQIKKRLNISSDGNLAWHIKVLKKAGYVSTTSTSNGSDKKRSELHVQLSKKGIKALEDYRAHINQLIPV
jgi:DNA-binding HxlR family transcriptional regulator